MRRPQGRVTPPKNQKRIDNTMMAGSGVGATIGGIVPAVLGHMVGIPDTIAMQSVGAVGGGYVGAKVGEALAHSALRKEQFKKKK